MFPRLVFGLCTLALVAACEVVPVDGSSTSPSQVRVPTTPQARSFAEVTARVEPIAERECRSRTSGVICDFQIVIDDRPNQPSNAYQFLDDNGRPIIAFTMALIQEARNADEIAFVMGHEAAHHIEGHIARQQDNAIAGAVIFAGLATLSGATAAGVDEATKLGAQVGARSFSKDFELEADELGTIITHLAGYSPLKGSAFFARIPDPGDRFLGTHPPNAARVQKVRDTVKTLQ